MTQDEKIYKETAKALIGYYSWHMDELLELYNAMGFPPDYIIDRDYNAMGQTHEKDLSKIHLKIEGDGAYIWMDGLHTYFIKL